MVAACLAVATLVKVQSDLYSHYASRLVSGFDKLLFAGQVRYA